MPQRTLILNLISHLKVSLAILVTGLLLVACGESAVEEATRINNETPPASSAPTATNVTISDNNGGNALVGDTLSGDYQYSDDDDDIEGATTYLWLRNDVAIGGAGGTGEFARKYTLMASDFGKTIVFEVTPKSQTGKISDQTGEAVSSVGIGVVANSAPTASDVDISIGGTNANANYTVSGDILTGSYTYGDIDNDNESTPIYSWFRGNEAIIGATGERYTVTAADVPFQIMFEVIPMALTGELEGSPVRSLGINTRRPLNDTGIIGCGDYAYTDANLDYPTTGSDIHNNGLNCVQLATTQTTDGTDAQNDIIRAGQDALYGRDVTHNDDSDGHAGFSYTKLDSNGNPLVNQKLNYTAQPWSCVKDNVTGLIWEVKTLTGLRSNRYTYTWYNPGGNDGGDKGIGDTGVGTTTGFETDTTNTTYIGSDKCDTASRCDTDKFRVDVNVSNGGAGLCGATDWRLPNKQELRSIVNYNRVDSAIDSNYFPNSQRGFYWSSSPYAGDSYSAWGAIFYYGNVGDLNKNFAKFVRLVRGSQ